MAGCGTKRMNMGGPTGMHKMPDGTMMKGAKHGMKAGGLTGPDKEGPKKRKKGKSSDPAAFPDLNNDGKVTQADVLMGRGVGKMNMGGKVMKYKAGGCVGDGCAIRGRTKGTMR